MSWSHRNSFRWIFCPREYIGTAVDKRERKTASACTRSPFHCWCCAPLTLQITKHIHWYCWLWFVIQIMTLAVDLCVSVIFARIVSKFGHIYNDFSSIKIKSTSVIGMNWLKWKLHFYDFPSIRWHKFITGNVNTSALYFDMWNNEWCATCRRFFTTTWFYSQVEINFKAIYSTVIGFPFNSFHEGKKKLYQNLILNETSHWDGIENRTANK